MLPSFFQTGFIGQRRTTGGNERPVLQRICGCKREDVVA